MNIKDALARSRSMWMCDVMEARIQSAEEERGDVHGSKVSTDQISTPIRLQVISDIFCPRREFS